jgi:hypothetical protein
VIATVANPPEYPGLAFFYDRRASFTNAYGAEDASFLVRPDGYIGWRGRNWGVRGFIAYMKEMLQPR